MCRASILAVAIASILLAPWPALGQAPGSMPGMQMPGMQMPGTQMPGTPAPEGQAPGTKPPGAGSPPAMGGG